MVIHPAAGVTDPGKPAIHFGEHCNNMANCLAPVAKVSEPN
jgi:hypothetical protein